MKKKTIIAAVGMAGSGKTEIIKYLQKKISANNIYLGEATFDRIKKEGWELNYENERIARETIRTEMGMGAYALLAIPKIEKILQEEDIVLLESMYSWEEYKIIKEKYGENFFVIATHASPKIRCKRLLSRSNERPIKDREEFNKRDYTEIEKTDKGGPIARADFMIVNEQDIEYLHKKIDKIINEILAV